MYTQKQRIIDCHAHIIDPLRFPFAVGEGYKPRADDIGTADMFCDLLTAHAVSHALLIQPSCYGFDNAALLHALESYPHRFKLIAATRPTVSDRELLSLKEAGTVGVRFNLVSHDAHAITKAESLGFLDRIRELGWFAEIYANDQQWPDTARTLQRSAVPVLIDHFGVRQPAAGTMQPGFQAVLALGRSRKATIKLSAPFGISSRQDLSDLDPFVEMLIDSFGVDGCIWGSDWPFMGAQDARDRQGYHRCWETLERWLPDSGDLDRVLSHNPSRLFGFGGS